jgi:hypothetical protein
VMAKRSGGQEGDIRPTTFRLPVGIIGKESAN